MQDMDHAALWGEFKDLNQKKRWEQRTLSPLERKHWRQLRLEIERILFRQLNYPSRDSREHLRLPADLTAFYHADGKHHRNPVTTLGEGGCFVAHPQPQKSGHELILDLILPRLTDSLTLKARVAWSTALSGNPGMGIQFIHCKPEQKATLYHFIDRQIVTGLGLDQGR